MNKLTPAQVSAFAELDRLATVLDADDLERMGIDLTPTETGDAFGPFDLQEEWAELDTISDMEIDETRPDNNRPLRQKTILDFAYLLPALLMVTGGYWWAYGRQ